MNSERKANLSIIKSIFDSQKIKFWLTDWTLLYAYKANMFSEIDSDDFGVWKNDLNLKKEKIVNQFIVNDFKIIKDNKYIIEIEKNKLIIRINLFYEFQKYCLSNEIKMPIKHFKKFNKLNLMGLDFLIPTNTNQLIEIIFVPSRDIKILRFLKSHFLNDLSPKKYYYQFYQFILNKVPLILINIIRTFFGKKRIVVKSLSFKQFKELNFANNGFDSVFRSNHINLLTNFGKNLKVGEIISHFENKGEVEKINGLIKETKMDSKFKEPIYYSRKFWLSGNNFFFYSFYFGFRKKVLPYEQSNLYIQKKIKPNLFSREYFMSLEEMNKNEILRLLNKKPIEIQNNSFGSGRHRVAAMIGRIVNGKSYIPLKVYYN
jgi:hypothetical protein